MRKLLALLFICFFNFTHTYSQQNLAEKLGYPKNAKLLIIHGDDAGLSHSQDSATTTALKTGAITSASIMVPCPWFPEIAAYAKQHPELDWGIHISLTSEWENYKWSGVSSSNEISSLLTKEKYLYASVEDFARNEKPAEAEKEIRAQIEKALHFGIKLTHVDSHMGSILGSPELIKIYQNLSKQYRLPVLVPLDYIRMVAPQMVKVIDTGNVAIVNNFTMAYPGVAAGKWKEFYDNAIKNCKPGLNEVVFHLAFDDNESKAIMTGHSEYGAAWRQRDFDYVMSEGFKALLKEENIHLVTWGAIKDVMYK